MGDRAWYFGSLGCDCEEVGERGVGAEEYFLDPDYGAVFRCGCDRSREGAFEGELVVEVLHKVLHERLRSRTDYFERNNEFGV